MSNSNSKVTNREAVALLLAFGNALHDAIHMGLLSPQEVVVLTLIAQTDAAKLLSGEKVEIRQHEGKTISLDDGNADKAQEALDNMVKAAMLMAPMQNAAGVEIKPTHTLENTGKLN